jgi:hypothetical protein
MGEIDFYLEYFYLGVGFFIDWLICLELSRIIIISQLILDKLIDFRYRN